jgi:hypothetical protein
MGLFMQFHLFARTRSKESILYQLVSNQLGVVYGATKDPCVVLRTTVRVF